MQRAFDGKRFWRVKQFFGKYIEKAVVQDPSVNADQNITRLGRPFRAEPDFQAGKFNIDIATDTEYSEECTAAGYAAIVRHPFRPCECAR
jgi:hypothetical protein